MVVATVAAGVAAAEAHSPPLAEAMRRAEAGAIPVTRIGGARAPETMVAVAVTAGGVTEGGCLGGPATIVTVAVPAGGAAPAAGLVTTTFEGEIRTLDAAAVVAAANALAGTTDTAVAAGAAATLIGWALLSPLV